MVSSCVAALARSALLGDVAVAVAEAGSIVHGMGSGGMVVDGGITKDESKLYLQSSDSTPRTV